MKGIMSEQIEDTKYSYGLVSGEQVVQLSGVVKLHSVIVNRGVSGGFYTIFDSAISGRFLSAGVLVVGLGYCGDAGNVPMKIDYDVGLNSGLVIVASGATWNITTTYK